MCHIQFSGCNSGHAKYIRNPSRQPMSLTHHPRDSHGRLASKHALWWTYCPKHPRRALAICNLPRSTLIDYRLRLIESTHSCQENTSMNLALHTHVALDRMRSLAVKQNIRHRTLPSLPSIQEGSRFDQKNEDDESHASRLLEAQHRTAS